MSQGSGFGGGPSFSQVENSLRNVAIQYTSIVSLQAQLGAGLTAWRDLQRELSLSRAAASGTAEDFNRMEAAARSFALGSTYSAAQVGSAFYNLASAGFTVKQTLEASTGVVLLAQATLTDLGEASDIAASALTQFNLQAAESYRVSNLFVAATNESLATVPKLAYALRQVGPVAYQANLSIEDTVATLSKLFDAGLRGEQAGTALRNTLVRLINPVGDGAKVLQNLGVNVYDTTGKMRNMLDVLKELSGKNLSVSEAAPIVGVEAVSGFLAIMKELRTTNKDGVDGIRALSAELNNSDAAYAQSVIQLNTLDGAIFRAQNSFNDLRIELGQLLTPAMQGLADVLQSLDETLTHNSDATKLNTVSTALWAVEVIGLFAALSRIPSALTGVVGSVGKLQSAWRDLTLEGRRAQGAMGMSVQQVAEDIRRTALANGATRAEAAARAATAQAENITQTEMLGRNAALASRGVGSLVSGLVGIAGTAVGIGAVAFALAEVANAAIKARDAANEANTALANKELLGRAADKRGLTGPARDRFVDQPIDPKAYAQQLNNIDKTGQDPFARTRMLLDAIQNGDDVRKLADERIKTLKDNMASVRQSMDEAYRIIAQYSAPGSGGSVSLQLGRSENTKKLTWDLISANILPEANFANAKDILKQRADKIIAIINTTKGLSDPERARIIEAERKLYDELSTKDGQATADFLNSLSKRAEIEQQHLVTNPYGRATIGSLGFDSLSNVFDNLTAGLKEDTAHLKNSADGFNNWIQKQQQDAERIGQLQLAAKNKLAGTHDALRKQISEFAVDLLSDGKTPQQVGEIRKFVWSDKWQAAFDDAAHLMETKDGPDLRGGIKHAFDMVQKQKLDGANYVMQQAAISKAMLIVDPNKLGIQLAEAQLANQQALVELMKSINNPEAWHQASIAASQELSISEKKIVDDFFNTLEHSTGFGPAIVQRANIDSVFRNRVAKAIMDSVNNQNDKGKGEVIKQITVENGTWWDTPGLGDAIAIAWQRIQAARRNKEKQQNDIVKEAKRAQSRDLKDDPAEKLLVDLMALPDAYALRLISDSAYIKAKYALTNYLNAPLGKAQQAIDEAYLAYRQSVNTVQSKYAKVFTDKLAVGVQGSVSNKSLIDAFSGATLASILGSKDGSKFDVLGSKFSSDMLQTQAGLNRYVDTVMAAFAKSVAGSVDAPARINVAKAQLIGMINEATAMQSEFSAKMATLNIETSKAKAAVTKAVQDFKDNQLLALFQEQVERNFFGGGNTIDIQIALRAEVVKVELNTRNAIDKVTKEFQDVFAQMGIAVGVQANGQLDFDKILGLKGGSPIATPANDMATLSQTIASAYQGRPKGTEADPIVIRTNRTSAQVAGGGTSISNVIAVLRAAGLNVNSGTRPTWEKDEKPGGATSQERLYNKWIAEGRPRDNPTARPGTSAHEAGGLYDAVDVSIHGTTRAAILKIFEDAGIAVRRSIMERGHLHVEFPTGGNTHNGTAGVGIPYTPQDPGTINDPAATMATAEDKARQKQFDLLRSVYEKRIADIQEIGKAELAFISDEKNAQILAYDSIQQYRLALYDEYQGKVSKALINQQQQMADFNKAVYSASISSLGVPGVDTKSAIVAARSAQIRQAQYQNTADAQTEIANLQRTAGAYRSMLEYKLADAKSDADKVAVKKEILDANQQQADSIAAINKELERKNELASSDPTLRRTFLKDSSDQFLAQGNREGNTTQGAKDGLKAGVQEFASTVPTIAETTKQLATVGLNGLADSMANLFVKGAGGARQMVASLLESMAMLIMKMLAMYAVIQLIRAIPGGSVVLAALDIGSKATGHADGGIGGLASSYALGGIQRAMAYAGGGTNVYFTSPAMNGMAPIMSDSQRAAGGVRNAKQPAISIFGEGDHPEAYIPMVDKHSIPVTFDAMGNAYVPLPSGQRVPVTMKGKSYASGGTNSYDNGAINRSMSAGARDAMNMAYAATGTHVAANNAGSIQHATVQSTTTVHVGDIIIQGNATKEDAATISDEVIARVVKYMDDRDAERQRHILRNRGDIQDSYGARM